MTRVKAAQRRLVRALHRSVFPEVVATILFIVAGSVGVVLVGLGLASPEQPGPPPWSGPFSVASPFAWAAAFLVASGVAGAAVAGARHVAATPVLILSFVWLAWSVLLSIGSADGGVPTSAVGSIGMTWLTFALAGLYWVEGRGPHAETGADDDQA